MRHTIHTLAAQSIVDDRIRHAAGQRAAREAVRRTAAPRARLRLHLRRTRHAVPSV